ncbi:telomere length regulator protein rif1 [Phialemonium atrogriseum]|uniref:Telomere length regulator protein rif1 n=1 Tax=Phialemonium atrogriseum TaxID=1093897 RepID=A0AAJ0BZ12_9PEZI|nr:telomere length regulator protein rif1 [Phialemonium atrogriseum]KAK1767120.1 telomere length regulator protein rif1 [Phialemonium atrogriseum]
MATPAVMLNLLQSLPPRPPTPPRETIHDSEAQTRHLAVCQPSGPRLNIQTPPGIYSPNSESDSNSCSSRRARKKVGFSAQAEYKEPPVYPETNTGKLHPTPVSLPPSSSKPVKSILKVTYCPNPLDLTSSTPFDPADAKANLAAMLDSTIQQLAGADRESRLDAYMMLVQALKASDNLPDRVALHEKMSLFMQFIQRDITIKASSSTVDSSLVNHALNLLITFFNFPAIASALSNDFGVFILDHCIRSFEDTSAPKDVVRRLMQVVAVQNFSPKVMTSDRVARLVSSLHKIEGHLKGKSIIMSRVLIYRKLVKQSRQLMVLHSDWLFDLFTDMLSGLKEIRSAAISLGLEAAFSIGKEKVLSRKVMEMLNLTSEDKTYIEYYEERLHAMGKEKADSASVPQIWSVVMLLLRCPFDKWDLFSRWLHIMQTCFNSSDFPTKKEANLAWSRLVYLVHLEDRSFSKMISTLSQPLASQLKRKGLNKNTEELRKIVLGGICNIFYYAFKPTTNLTLLDGYWDNCAKPLMKQLLDRKADNAPDGLSQASAILSGLFDCSTPRLWKEDHVTQHPLVRPEELPAIDSKWVRRNASRVFGIVGPILERDLSAVADSTTATHRLWRALVGTVASAASKEIKVSIDTANFVAHAFNVLQNVWARGPKTGNEAESSSQFLKGVLAYLGTMVDSLGLLPFTEKLLSMDKQNHFIPITTPTHRPGKSQGMTKAPLHHLFSILSTLPPLVPDDDKFASFFASAFAPFFTTKSDKGRMDLAEDLLSSLPMDALSPYGPWLLVADKISMWLEAGPSSVQTSFSGSEAPVGHDYRDIARVLERGLKSTPNLPWKSWQSLFSSLCFRCRDEAGDAGVAIVAIEPLAKVLLDMWSAGDSSEVTDPGVMAKCTAELLSMATQPRDRQAVDAARRRLWGTVVSGTRSASFDTFDHLYKLVNLALAQLYQAAIPQTAEGVVSLLREIGGFLDRSNPQLVLKSLLILQSGIAFWIQDNEAETRRQHADVVEAVKSLWEKTSSILATSDQTRHLQLDALEPLLCAAFGSKHRHIVNTTLSLWNGIFDQAGDAENLEYPEGLKAILLSLRPFVDIVLPGLEASSIESGGREPFFVESQDDMPRLSNITSTKSSRATPRPTSSSRRSVSPSLRLFAAAKRRPDPTPNRKSGNRRSTTPRLRHDDSQVQFAAIESSPVGDDLESQVLTEHQKEVRERQKENAALFPEIRSSPNKAKSGLVRGSSRASSSHRSPVNQRTETPAPEGTFDDYVASTPTPRRGRPLPIADQDHDMTDPPSSPPEPRRNPLLAEIQSRSASSSLMDEWQFSSSPISGSPSQNRAAPAPEQPTNGRDLADGCREPGREDDEIEDGEDDAMDQAESELPTSNADDMVENDILVQKRAGSSSLDAPEEITEQLPSTPPQYPRPPQYQETPKSDNEVFIDARASPLPSTPRRSQRAVRSSMSVQSNPRRLGEHSQNSSLNISNVDEMSVPKLVVELDSGRFDSSDYRQLSDSPDKLGQPEEALDCIVVGQSPSNNPGETSSKQSISHPVTPTKPSTEAEEAATASSQVTSGSGRKRRGRSSSKAHGAGKKRKRQETETERAMETVADSQHNAVGDVIQLRKGRVAKKKRPSPEAVEQQSQEEHIASSWPEFPSQALPEVNMHDAVAPGSEEYEVHSQIVQEAKAQGVRSQTGEPETEMSSAMQVETTEAGAAETERQAEAEAEAMAQEEQAEAAKDGGGILSRIMTTLQGGLNALRTAKLSREEVYQVEDIFMDMKRELYEAERRGRA